MRNAMDDTPPIPPTWHGLMNQMAQASAPDMAWAALEQAHAELQEAARRFDAAAGEPVIGEIRALRRVRLNDRELPLG